MPRPFPPVSLRLTLCALLLPMVGCAPALASLSRPGPPAPAQASTRAPTPRLTAGPRLAPQPLPSQDRARLKGWVAGLRHADAQRGIWPGFQATGIPLVLHEPDRVAYMLHHPHPTAPFAPAAGWPEVALTHELEGLPRGLALKQPLGDRLGVVIVFGRDDDQTLLTAYHELFHAYQDQKAFFQGLTSDVKARSATDLGRAEAEQALLARALGATDPAARKADIRRFLAVRAERHRGAEADFVANEDGLEAIEGTARYLEAHMQIVAEGVPEVPRSPAFMDRANVLEQLASQLQSTLSPEAFRRWRYMLTGAAMGFLLDELGAPWKGQMEQGARMAPLLASAVGYREADQDRLLAEAEAEVGVAARIAGAEARLAAAAGAQRSALAEFEAAPGPRVELRVHASYGGFSLAASENHAVGPETELYGPDTQLNIEHPPELSVMVEGRVLIRTLRAGNAFTFHAPGASWRFNGGALPADGTAEGELSLTAPGVTLRASPARVTVAGDAITIALPPYSELE